MTGDAVSRQRTVAIVEAGHGLGREVAIGLASRGYRIYGTAQTEDQAADLDEVWDGAITLTVTDICDRDSVDTWVGAVLVSLGERGLDVLVISRSPTPGPLATLAIIEAFLLSLRMARGRIVHISSATGRAALLLRGPASVMVTAPEAMAQLSRTTLEPLGIGVVTLELDGAGRTESGATAAERVIEVVDGLR
jgi:short chain dehydrogenase